MVETGRLIPHASYLDLAQLRLALRVNPVERVRVGRLTARQLRTIPYIIGNLETMHD